MSKISNAALLAETRTALGVTSDSRDAEILMLIEAAKEHLKARDLLTGEETASEITGLRKTAIIVFVKANFGFDNPDHERFMNVFKCIVCDLINTDLVNEE